MDDMVGAQEIADLLGVSRQRVHQFAAMPEFPKPLKRLNMGLVWSWPEVEKWAKATKRWPVKDED